MDKIDKVLSEKKPVLELTKKEIKENLENPEVELTENLTIRQKALLKVLENLFRIDIPLVDLIVKILNVATFALVIVILVKMLL